MAQLFPSGANQALWAALALSGLALAGLAWGSHLLTFSSFYTGVGVPLNQPVPFSHEHHVSGLGIDCRYCHTSVEEHASAGIPPTETCMTCHSQVWRDAPVLAPVRESWQSGNRLHWRRVHDLPDYVFFNHSAHVKKGVACVTCHGRVDRMPLVWKDATLYMRWCLECHRNPAPHLGSPQSVTQPVVLPGSHTQVAALGLPTARMQDCSLCHR